MLNVALYGTKPEAKDRTSIKTLFDSLDEHDAEVSAFEPWFRKTQQLFGLKEMPVFNNRQELSDFNPNLMITLGGDGTILSGVAFQESLQLPILGINLGRLGFLAATEKTYIERAVKLLSNGSYHISQRTMLRIQTEPELFGSRSFALNDFTLHKRDTSSMVTIHVSIDGTFLNSYWADGLIIATPTGSTGYSLSCGGPILYPHSGNFVLTPVAPHNLNVRPVVVSDDSCLELEIEGRSQHFLATLDARSKAVSRNHKIELRRNNFTADLIQLEGHDFASTLRNKLAWGADIRN